MDHIDQAIYDTVHNSSVSAKEISQRLGMSHQVLINKANPQSEFHKLTLREALAIQLITGNDRIVKAMEVELDMNQPHTATECLLEAVLKASKEHGDVVKAIHEALEDNRFTLREKEQCQREIDEAIEALQSLRASVIAHK